MGIVNACQHRDVISRTCIRLNLSQLTLDIVVDFSLLLDFLFKSRIRHALFSESFQLRFQLDDGVAKPLFQGAQGFNLRIEALCRGSDGIKQLLFLLFDGSLRTPQLRMEPCITPFVDGQLSHRGRQVSHNPLQRWLELQKLV